MAQNSSGFYGFHKQLDFEAEWLPRMEHDILHSCALKDVTKEPAFQPLGVDMLAKWPGRAPTGLEFKFDKYTSTNLALEYVSVDRQTSPNGKAWADGWMITSQAGWLLYGFISTGDLLVLDMAVLRHWLAKNYHRFESTSVPNRGYFTYCSLVPMAALCAELPKDSWYWINMRHYVKDVAFERALMAPATVRKTEINSADLAYLFSAGNRRTAPLELDEEAMGALHTHLWNSDRKHAVYSQPGEKRNTVLKPLPFLQESLAAA